MSYIDDTEYATRHLIELAVKEEASLDAATQKLHESQRLFQLHQWDFQTSSQSDDFSDAYLMAAHTRMGSAHEKVNELKRETAALKALLDTHEIAVQAICGAILQIAKLGISFVHGDGRLNAPEGRRLGTLPVRDIVWQARNQAMHYELKSFHPPVVEVFAQLERDHGIAFSLQEHKRQSRARQIIDLLGWRTYEAYVADAQELKLT